MRKAGSDVEITARRKGNDAPETERAGVRYRVAELTALAVAVMELEPDPADLAQVRQLLGVQPGADAQHVPR